jgi:DHA1 family multidrug resistance protein-like MFS transporter
MTNHFRDTQFGELVRFLSRNSLFQYPDEVDTSLWERSIAQKESTNASEKEFRIENSDSQISNTNHFVDDGRNLFLVDWYGRDDPEVFNLANHRKEFHVLT